LGEFSVMSSQSHLPHCRVLPRSEFSVMIPDRRVTLQGTATWWIHWHVIPEPRVTLRGRPTVNLVNSLSWSPHVTLHSAVTWRNQCHDCATLQGIRIPSAILKIDFAIFYIYFCFINAVWALTSGGFRIVSNTLVSVYFSFWYLSYIYWAMCIIFLYYVYYFMLLYL